MHRFLRYAAVGALATAVHYALLAWAVERCGWAPPCAAGVGATAGAQVAFLCNRRFTFAHRGPAWPAWRRFQLASVLGMVISVLGVAAGLALGWHYLLAQALATLVSLGLTFALNRRWAFG